MNRIVKNVRSGDAMSLQLPFTIKRGRSEEHFVLDFHVEIPKVIGGVAELVFIVPDSNTPLRKVS